MDRGQFSFRTRKRLARFLAIVAATVIVGLVPTTVSAESFCGQARSLAFTLPAPDSFSSPGLHRFEWRETYLDPEGSPVTEYIANQVETVPGTDLYTGSVLLRIASVWGVEANGDLVTDVQAIDPEQSARFYASVGWFRDDPFGGQNVLSVRWETAAGWTDWVSVPRGPETGFCESFRANIVRPGYGWAS